MLRLFPLRILIGFLWWAVFAWETQAADRTTLLTEPGVYATFAVFSIDADWWKLDKNARASAAAVVKDMIRKHSEKMAIDVYLLRGLSAQADFFLRLHAQEMLDNQNFLLELMSTLLGRHLRNTQTFNGLTKKANYVPGFSEDLKAALKAQADAGPTPYAIVMPIQKDAEWWRLDQASRIEMMKEHTEAAVAYLKTVKRKLYHATGLGDLDFITYFETARLDDFHNLIIALEKVQENRHYRRFGHPTLLGSIRLLDEILEILTK